MRPTPSSLPLPLPRPCARRPLLITRRKQLHVLEVISKRAEEDNVALQAKYNALEHRQFRLSKTHDETISNLKDSREAEMRTQKALERSGLAYYQILGALKKRQALGP